MEIIGIAGGSGSGKTRLSGLIKDRIPERTVLMPLDRYYKPFYEKSHIERMNLNFDHPRTLDRKLL